MTVPQRTCIGCRQVRVKEDLIKIVNSPVDGLVIADRRTARQGRGAYICPNMECIYKAMQPHILSRAFRISPNSMDSIDLEIIGKLKQNLLDLVAKV